MLAALVCSGSESAVRAFGSRTASLLERSWYISIASDHIDFVIHASAMAVWSSGQSLGGSLSTIAKCSCVLVSNARGTPHSPWPPRSGPGTISRYRAALVIACRAQTP